MSTAPRRLGRGLEALLGSPLPAGKPHLAVHDPDGPTTHEPQKVSVYEIDSNPYQPRREFDEAEIASLAESLDQHGLLQPIVVRKIGDRYQLIAGERRLRAAIKAGWPEVTVILREADDRQLAEWAIVENLQRKDLNALEKGASFQQYLEQYQCTQEELARRLAIDRSTVANFIRLLELPAPVQSALRSGALSQGHARALLPLGDDKQQIELATRIQTEGLSVRAVEQLVGELLQAEDSAEAAELPLGAAPSLTLPPATGKAPRQPRRVGALAGLEQQLRTALGAKVEIRQTAKGRGKIVVHFTTSEEFDRLRALLGAA